MPYHRLSPLLLAAVLVTCSAPPKGPPSAATQPDLANPVLVDFETPGFPARWTPAAPSDTQPADTQPASILSRSSLRPLNGLWSAKITLADVSRAGGTLWYTQSDKPIDLGRYNLLEAGAVHLAGPAANGRYVASLILEDASGKRIEGDCFPVTSRWEQIPFDLAWAFDNGLDISRITAIGLTFRPATPTPPDEPPLEIQTDAWRATSRGKAYLGTRLPPAPAPSARTAQTFFVESQSTRLRVGNNGTAPWEVSFYDRGTTPDPKTQRPWLEISSPGLGGARQLMVGAPGTGLLLLGPDSAATLATALQRGPDTTDAGPRADLPAFGWPIAPSAPSLTSACRWHWEVVWTSHLGALVELKQETGPYDRLGEPGAFLTWRFMIYQWGQIFVHADWVKGETPIPDPVSWALILPEDVLDRRPDLGLPPGVDPAPVASPPRANAERLLSEVYPFSVRDGLQSALPHRMQTGAPVAMIARPPAGPNARTAWWWTRGTTPGDNTPKKLAGSALPQRPASPRGSADCMLLVNAPNALMKAGAFGQYLVPPKVLFRQGELDRNFPGDADNDGFVESYGFQTVRLSNGRATFTIYPQGRPLFYPVYLFTVPAVEKDALDLDHSRVLINIDGKQFADPPQFPDGSFLLQLPFTVDRPVTVEALLVKK